MNEEQLPFPVTPFVFSVTALVALVLGYLWLVQKMRAAKIERPPYVHYLVVFVALASFPVMNLVILIKEYNDPEHIPIYRILTVMGFIPFPLFVAPMWLFLSSFVVLSRRNASPYHKAAFWSGLAYISLIIIALFAAKFTDLFER